jgi:hypothetical protein
MWENVGSDDRHDDADEINNLFEKISRQEKTESFEAFVTSVYLWWESRGFLTEKQYRVIKRAATENGR